MKVNIKDLAVSMQLGNNGVQLDVYDNGVDTSVIYELEKLRLNGARGGLAPAMATR